MSARIVSLATTIVVTFCVVFVGGIQVQESIYLLGPRLFDYSRENNQSRSAAAVYPPAPDNLIASPLGVALGLGLIEIGANPQLKRLIFDDILSWTDSEIDFHRNLTRIQRSLRPNVNQRDNVQARRRFTFNNGRSTSDGRVPVGEDKKDLEVNVQCAIFHQEGVQVTKDFSAIAAHYEAELISLNKSLAPGSRQAIINEWVSRSTRNLIRAFPVPDNFQMLLANTVYFEGDWVQPFASEYTRKGVFKPTHDANHNLEAMYLMSQMDDIPYYEDEMFQMIELAYEGGGAGPAKKHDISMFVLLPRVGKTVPEMVYDVTYNKFQDVRKHKMEPRIVNVKMPKISLSHRLNIKEVMETVWNKKVQRSTTANQPAAVSPPNFQLGSASSDPAFILSDFIQETVLEVNEKGTRVASISGGTINYDGSKKVLRCDRPYLMMIHDNRNEVVLFWAAIYKPASSGGPR